MNDINVKVATNGILHNIKVNKKDYFYINQLYELMNNSNNENFRIIDIIK